MQAALCWLDREMPLYSGAVWLLEQGGTPAPPRADRDQLPGARLSSVLRRPALNRSSPTGGLGLALCRRIAEAHGGTVTLEPSERGAAFRITIPDAAA